MMFLSHFKNVITSRKKLKRLSTQWVIVMTLLSMLSGAFAAPAAASVQIEVAKVASVKSCTASPALRPGDRGSCVSLLQRILLNSGYNLGVKSPTGAYLAMTKAAVVRFQRDNKLKPDAIVGPITWKKLGGISTKPAPVKSKPVILTFDDCPSSAASANKTLLAAKGMGMHFRLYVTGECLKAKRFDVATARKYGHTVCSHSNNHKQLTLLSKAQIRKEMNVAGLTTSCGRPPYGAVNANVRAIFKEKKMSLDLWDVDTNDWRGKTKAQIVSWTVRYSQPGDVVLMHFHRGGFSPDALKDIKVGLAKRGLSVK